MLNRLNIIIVALLVVIVGALVTDYVIEMQPDKAAVKSKSEKNRPQAVVKTDHLPKVIPAAEVDPVASAADVDEEPEDESSGTLTETLKGKDFVLKTWEHEGAPVTQTITVEMEDGSSVDNWVGPDGSKTDLANLSWNAEIELKNLIPNMPREQIISHTSDWYPRGEGTFDTYTICLVDKDKLTEVFSVITGRDFDGIGDRPAISFSATVEEVLKDGELSILYRYQDKKSKNRTIIFKWNGKTFVDTTGKYKSIENKYSI